MKIIALEKGILRYKASQIIMDKKLNIIHKNLIAMKINRHSVHTQQLICLITGQPSYQLPS